MKVSVIIPAAGRGKRFGGKDSKVLASLAGRPVFLRTLELFVNRDDVCQVLLVVNPDDRAGIVQRYGGNLGLMDVSVVSGGAERTDSVRNALAEVAEEADLVAVHDAVRPCVSPLWIDAVFAAAGKTGSAILAIPLHGTLKKVASMTMAEEGVPITLGSKPIRPKGRTSRREWAIDRTVRQSSLWEAQTPQVFRRDLLVGAYAAAADEAATDDAQLVEAQGHQVAVVAGDPRNIKITTQSDMAVAAAVLGSLPKPKPKADGSPFGEAQW